jgi:predicted nucleic acid-binding protein
MPANPWKPSGWKTGDEGMAVSVITVLELAHGIVRADTPERRQRFLDDLLTGMPVQPVTLPIALRAGQIDGQSQAKGAHPAIGSADVRHFQPIKV